MSSSFSYHEVGPGSCLERVVLSTLRSKVRVLDEEALEVCSIIMALYSSFTCTLCVRQQMSGP